MKYSLILCLLGVKAVKMGDDVQTVVNGGTDSSAVTTNVQATPATPAVPVAPVAPAAGDIIANA